MAEQRTDTPATTPSDTREPVMFPYTSVPIPEPFAGVIDAVGSRWSGLRHHLMTTLPPFIINNSSNVVGFEQLIAEGLLFKSNNFNLWSEKVKSNPLYYLLDPPVNVVKAAFGKFKNTGRKFEWFNPSAYVEAARGFADLERAAKIDSMGGKLQLTNNLSALSSLSGMSAMTIAAFLPDHKETPEETQQMATLSRENPVGYVGHRLLQAVNPFAWWDNKRQFSGLGMVGAGTFSLFSGFRQIRGEITGQQTYGRNPWHMAGGAITALSGLQLLLAVNNEQGWSNYGSTQLGRIITLPNSIGNRYKPNAAGTKDLGRHWYFGGQAVMVAKNATSSLIGGGHVKNGELVDHEAMREAAREKAQEEHRERKAAKPSSLVQEVSREAMVEPGMAMQL